MNAAPVMGTALGFVRVIVSRDTPLRTMTFCVNVIAAVGSFRTVRVAEAGLPVPAFVVVMLPELLL